MRKRLYFMLMASISMVLPILFPDIAVRYFDMKNDDEFLEVVAVLLVCCVIIARSHLNFVIKVFDKRLVHTTRLKYLVASYLYTIVAFAGIYFLLIFIFDFIDADNDYRRYRAMAMQSSAEDMKYILEHDLRVLGNKAFHGIRDELWMSVDSWELPTNQKQKEVKNPNRVPLTSVLESARRDRAEVIHYRSDNRWTVYGDCLYLSAITVATVGYGDIAPVNYYAKFFVALEVIIGQIIMVIGLGTVFSNMYRSGKNGGEQWLK